MSRGAALASALLLVACSGPEPSAAPAEVAEVAAPPPSRADARPNAALEYARIRDAMGSGFFDPLMDVSTLEPPGPEAARHLQAQQDVVRQIIEASRIERCDFAAASARPTDMLLLVKILQFDAHRLVRLRGGEAAERLAALLRMVSHAAAAPGILARLSAGTTLEITGRSIVDWKDHLRDPRSRAMLLEELTRLEGGDLFDVRRAMAHELEEARRLVAGGRLELIVSDAVVFEPHERAGILREVEQAHASILAAWGRPEGQRVIQGVVDGLESSKAHKLVSWLAMAHDQMSRARARLQGAIAAMQP
jgi:hypothetical protein